jgi:hypothetical protein
MAFPVTPNIDGTNPGPASMSTVNTQSPYSTLQFTQTIAVTLTPVATATITVAEQSFGANGVSFVSAATGIRAGDIITAVSPPSTVAGIGISQYRVDAAVNDKFYISFANPTAGSLTMPSGVYLITVARYNLSNASVLPTALVPQ